MMINIYRVSVLLAHECAIVKKIFGRTSSLGCSFKPHSETIFQPVEVQEEWEEEMNNKINRCHPHLCVHTFPIYISTDTVK